MNVESIPNFIPSARRVWESVRAGARRRLLAHVWCGDCRREVTITNFTGVIRDRNLLLLGKCAECHGDVARVIEPEWTRKESQ